MNQPNQPPASRQAALQVLENFLHERVDSYRDQRNYDFGRDNNEQVSRLSAALRYRLLTEEEVVRATLTHGSYEAHEKFIMEVCWRTYWKGWLENRPYVWTAFDQDRQKLLEELATDPLYQSATGAKTEIDCFNYWVHELKETGYLHNHARMWFASIWVHTLNLPWQLGADLFENYLLDGDPASNTLGWRWVAGIQTKGKAYLATRENIKKFTKGRFDPPELAPRTMSVPDLPDGSELVPLPDLNQHITDVRIWVTWPDDLSPEMLIPTGQSLCVYLVPPWALDRGRSDLVRRYQQKVCSDSMTRLQALGHQVILVETMGFLRDRLSSQKETQVAWLRPFVGQCLREANELINHLTANRRQVLSIEEYRRKWDADLFPLATKGFFAFKKHLAGYLAMTDCGG